MQAFRPSQKTKMNIQHLKLGCNPNYEVSLNINGFL